MSLLSNEEIVKITNVACQYEECTLLNYSIRQKSGEALGYLGKHLTLTTTIILNGNKIEKGFFVKTYDTEMEENFVSKTGLFQKEIDFYNILVKDLNRLQGKLSWCPEFYFSKTSALVLEDLSERGFKPFVEDMTLDKAHVNLALKTLSRMHASGLLLERVNMNSLPSTYPQIFKEILYDENTVEAPSRRWVSWQIQDLLEGINLMDKYSLDEKKFIKDQFADEIMRIYPLSKPSYKYRNVLTHGDMWKNNLLFRYSGCFPSDCIFVDFQFVRFSPPAHDVMHLLYYVTNEDMRNRETMDFLRHYYENLNEELKGYDIDAENVMSWDEFVESCSEYKELALIQSLLSLHYLLGPVTLGIEAETIDRYEEYLSNHRKEYMRELFNKESYVDKIKSILHELINSYIMRKQILNKVENKIGYCKRRNSNK